MDGWAGRIKNLKINILKINSMPGYNFRYDRAGDGLAGTHEPDPGPGC
jgi:hypothetical protein